MLGTHPHFNEIQNKWQKLTSFFQLYFPIIETIQKYNAKEKILGDLCSGFVLGLHTFIEGNFSFCSLERVVKNIKIKNVSKATRIFRSK